ncbi:MAG: hypothetical protein AB7O26_18650 [Planctomycetaceae bacterium]
MKRKSAGTGSEQASRKIIRHGGHLRQIPGADFPWKEFFVRFIDNRETNSGCLEIEYAGEVVDEVGLSLTQTAVMRMLVAKVLESGATHRSGTLISTKVILNELSQRFDDELGVKVWDSRAVHDLIYDVRVKLRTSHAARWASKELGQDVDFGLLVVGYDDAYRRYGLNIPKDRLEIVQLT